MKVKVKVIKQGNDGKSRWKVSVESAAGSAATQTAIAALTLLRKRGVDEWFNLSTFKSLAYFLVALETPLLLLLGESAPKHL